MWDVEMLRLLRHCIADLGTGLPPVYNYDDSRLQELLIVSAQFVQGDISTLQQKYTVNVSTLTLSPDPTIAAVRDDAFINLVVFRAACIIDNSEARAAASRAIMLRDAGKIVDMTHVAEAKLAVWQRGWCNNYADTKFEYLAGASGMAGQAIMGPFRLEYNAYGGGGNWTPDGGGGIYGGGVNVYGGFGRGSLANDGRFR